MRIQFTLFILLCQVLAYSQVKGTITDTSGEPLAYANIYVNETSTGTTSNMEGQFELLLEDGSYEIIFQYVGYKQAVQQVELKGSPITIDVVLQPESLLLNEVVVQADAEDPAYAIIRKAIKKRSYYKDLIKAYTCNTYVKGNQKVLDAPEKFMGQEIGDMGGNLDTNRQGIVYLSESQSKLYYQYPNDKKEVMVSSKVSGNDNGFSFNRASLMDFSFYENTIDLGRPIISPIANAALSYYKYKLIGTVYDEQGRLINKIKVIPKRNTDPVFMGMIYIVEESWNIYSTDLSITGASIQQPILDTLSLRQTHVPLEDDKWVLLSQVIDFNAGIFAFKIAGTFTGIFSNYDLNPTFEKGFFTNEVFSVSQEANDKDSVYWESIRPVPLTVEETTDYVVKDSLQVVWESKPYLDSIDRVSNKFNFFNLLTGYSYSQSYKKQYLAIESPVSALQYNTIQGLAFNLDVEYRKELDDDNLKWFEIKPVLQYGLSDEQLRGQLGFRYNFNKTNYAQLGITGGRMLTQYDANPAISPFLNTAYTLLAGENYLKAYDKTFANIRYRQELVNGIRLRTSLEYAQRSNVVNTTSYTWAKNDNFTDNIPLYEPSKNLTFDLELRFRIHQKYSSYPNRKFIQGSKYPDLYLNYRRGRGKIDESGFNTGFDFISFRIHESYLSTGRSGYFMFNIEGGMFLFTENLTFPDFQHFHGNQTLFANPSNYYNTFKRLPYYEFSTLDKYMQVHFEQHFSGFLLDKVPLIRKLGWQTVVGASMLYTPLRKDYVELSLGIDNIGFKAFRFFRFDVVAPFRNGNFTDLGFVIGLKI